MLNRKAEQACSPIHEKMVNIGKHFVEFFLRKMLNGFQAGNATKAMLHINALCNNDIGALCKL